MKIKVNVPNSLILSLEMVGTRRSFQGKKFFSHQDVLTNKSHTQGAHTHTQKTHSTRHNCKTATIIISKSITHTKYHKKKKFVQCGREKVLSADPTCEAATFYMNFKKKNLYTFTTSHTRCLTCYFLRLLSYTRFLSGWIEVVNCIRLHTDVNVNSRSLHC